MSGAASQIAKIFVGRLAWKTSTDTLSNYFAKYGAVSDARIIADRETGRSKGFGFVTFADKGSMENALRQPAHEIDGRSIIVNVANERPPAQFGSSGGNPRFNNNNNQGGNRPPRFNNNNRQQNDNVDDLDNFDDLSNEKQPR